MPDADGCYTLDEIAQFDVWAIPGRSNIIDVVHPKTGRTAYCDRDEAGVLAEYPGAVRFTADAWRADAIARQHTPVTWIETTYEQYQRMLEVLPPIEWRDSAFCVGEPMDHDVETGAPRYEAYRIKHGQYFHASRPLTVNELRKERGA